MSKKLVIFSDIDGTLLCRNTYRVGSARDALWECLFLGIDVVLVSSKNRHEIISIRRDLGINSPFIAENGGGLFIPRYFTPSILGVSVMGAVIVGSYWRLSWDGEITTLRSMLRRSAEDTGVKVRPFSQLNAGEIASITGLTLSQADLAKYREYDEPFLIDDETPEKVNAIKTQIQRYGYRYAFGGKFHHISGNFNKADRVRFLQALYMQAWPDVSFAAIGDAQNDLPMLQEADYPFLVREPGGSFDKTATFDGVTITEGVGPEGFAEAVGLLIQNYLSGEKWPARNNRSR